MPEQILAGKYVVQNEIARGGMGVIYKALDRTLNRIVAIKMVHAHLSGDSSFVQRFLREARAMARLQHDNIVTIYAVEEDRGTPLLVMEYFQGRNLRELTKNRPRLPLRDIVRITEQLANALAFAHAHGIIHRDIKPANVMVDARGKAKLTDFGIAAALDEASITSAGQVIGTPEYMSPEQACGTKLDGRSDLYSVGILLYEMLTGTTPYVEDSKTSILGKLAFDKKELTLAFPPDVPSLLQGVVRDLLRRQPEERIPDADTLATQLHEILYTLPQTPIPAQEESEPTMVLPSYPSQADDRTRAISPGWETVPTPLGSTEHRERSASAESFPSREAHPAPQKPPRGGDETTVLPERSQVPPEYKRLEPTFPPPPHPVPGPSAFPIKSLIVGGLLLVAALAGLVSYLGSRPGTGTLDGKPPVLTEGTPMPPPSPPERKVDQLKEKLKILEETLTDGEKLLRSISDQLQRERQTAECPTLKTGLTDTYGKYEDAVREVNRVRQELGLEPAAAASRPVQLDMECEKPKRSFPVVIKPKPTPTPEPKPEPAPPTPLVQVATAFPDAQLRLLLEKFKQAYERRDLGTLRSISRMSEARQRNVEMMFGNYETLMLSIASITPEDNGAAAVMVIDTAITGTGETVALTPIAKNITLRVARQGEGWDKIVW